MDSATLSTRLEVLDWRRQVSALYVQGRVMHTKDPQAVQQLGQAGRNHLFKTHPQSPFAPREKILTVPAKVGGRPDQPEL